MQVGDRDAVIAQFGGERPADLVHSRFRRSVGDTPGIFVQVAHLRGNDQHLTIVTLANGRHEGLRYHQRTQRIDLQCLQKAVHVFDRQWRARGTLHTCIVDQNVDRPVEFARRFCQIIAIRHVENERGETLAPGEIAEVAFPPRRADDLVAPRQRLFRKRTANAARHAGDENGRHDLPFD